MSGDGHASYSPLGVGVIVNGVVGVMHIVIWTVFILIIFVIVVLVVIVLVTVVGTVLGIVIQRHLEITLRGLHAPLKVRLAVILVRVVSEMKNQ